MGLSIDYAISPIASQVFDNVRTNNGRFPTSVSRSLSSLFKVGAPFGSRENSMDFRRGEFGGKREMSIELLGRDVSMDFLFAKKMGSQGSVEGGDLVRDMSVDCFTNPLRSTNRDVSMEMQFPHGFNAGQSGSALEFGWVDDIAFGVPSQGIQSLRNDHSSGHEGRERKLTKSKIGMSQDDLMIPLLSHQNAHGPYRRNCNGSTSIEDFRELKMPF